MVHASIDLEKVSVLWRGGVSFIALINMGKSTEKVGKRGSKMLLKTEETK